MTERTFGQEELTTRQREILGIVVREYVNTALPVGSITIAQRYPLGVSSATIRNELAYLDEAGFLAQPHTSAGRVPTEKGYRYFVARLMEEAELSLAEQRMIRHQFHQVQMDLDQWMRLTAAVLAHTARAASLVTSPYSPQARLKHVKLIAVSEMRVLLVLVLHGGAVRQEMMSLSRQVSQDELELIANRVNSLFQGLTIAEIEGSRYMPSSLEREALAHVVNMMRQEEKPLGVTLYRDGLTDVLQQPEFAEGEKARHLVRMLEERDILESMLLEASGRNSVQVIIGSEGRWGEMEDYSMILSGYGVLGHAAGALGVLGPLRMSYHRAVSVVRYVSRLLNELIGDFYTER